MKKKLIFILLFLLGVLRIEGKDLFLGVNVEGIDISKKELEKLEEEIGFTPKIVNIFLQWPKDMNEMVFPELLSEIWEMGAIPSITWEPMSLEKEIIFLQNIISKKYDTYLNFFAEELKKWQKPVILRFAHEMNLSSYHWGVKLENYDETYPELYKKMYIYVYLFLAKRTENVLFAFCPNVDSIPKESWNVFKNYYPGDNYVDILGLDGYNFNNRNFKEIFEKPFNELRKINSKKPFFIFETATSGYKRKAWIEDALKISKEWKIDALLWFQIDKEKKWKITKNEKEAFSNIKSSSSQKWILEVLNEKRRAFKKN